MIDYKRNKRVLIYDTTAVSADKYNAGANDSANTCSRRFHYYRARSALCFCPHGDAEIHTHTHTHAYTKCVVWRARDGDKIIFYHEAREIFGGGHPAHHVFNGPSRHLFATQKYVRLGEIEFDRRGYGFCDESKYQLAELFF